MKTHLTEGQLLQRQFGLAEVQAAQAMDQHLSECADCRRRQTALQRRFASLDLIKDDVQAPEALVAGVLDQVQRPSTLVWFRFPKLAAAAAILLVGFVASLYLTGTGPDEGMPERMAAQEQLLSPEAAVATAEGLRVEADFAVSAPAEPSAAESAAALARELAALRAEDPFIPGSNIELNVLPARDRVQLTIYNAADLTLVRERRVLTMKRGWNWLQFMWANTLIDPTSLQLETIEPAHRGKVELEALVFPPRLRELGRWLLFSEVSGAVPVEITYFTSGISWRAFYVGTLAPDEQTMRLEAYVRADNHSGEDYENAQTRLLVGKVNLLDQIADLARRQHAYGRPDAVGDRVVILRGLYGSRRNEPEPMDMLMVMEDSGALGADGDLRQKEITKEGLSEYFLYTIEGRETIKHGWGKRLPSFDAEDIPVESLYKYNEDRWGEQTIRFVSFANDADHELGETPLPDGNVRIFRRLDAQDHLHYVGAAAISYIPVDEQIELQLGAAREVQVRPRRMEVRTEHHVFDQNGNVNGYDEVQVWCLKVSNTREIPVKVEITRNFNANKWDLTTTESGYEKHDLTHGRFTLELEPRTTRELWYTLRLYHGRRAE